MALSGDGADELFGGYNTYLADGYAKTLRRFPRAARKAAASAAALLPVSDEKIGLDYKITPHAEGSLLEPIDAHFYWNGTFRRKRSGARCWRIPLAQPARFPSPAKPTAISTAFCGWTNCVICPTTSSISATA